MVVPRESSNKRLASDATKSNSQTNCENYPSSWKSAFPTRIRKQQGFNGSSNRNQGCGTESVGTTAPVLEFDATIMITSTDTRNEGDTAVEVQSFGTRQAPCSENKVQLYNDTPASYRSSTDRSTSRSLLPTPTLNALCLTNTKEITALQSKKYPSRLPQPKTWKGKSWLTNECPSTPMKSNTVLGEAITDNLVSTVLSQTQDDNEIETKLLTEESSFHNHPDDDTTSPLVDDNEIETKLLTEESSYPHRPDDDITSPLVDFEENVSSNLEMMDDSLLYVLTKSTAELGTTDVGFGVSLSISTDVETHSFTDSNVDTSTLQIEITTDCTSSLELAVPKHDSASGCDDLDAQCDQDQKDEAIVVHSKAEDHPAITDENGMDVAQDTTTPELFDIQSVEVEVANDSVPILKMMEQDSAETCMVSKETSLIEASCEQGHDDEMIENPSSFEEMTDDIVCKPSCTTSANNDQTSEVGSGNDAAPIIDMLEQKMEIDSCPVMNLSAAEQSDMQGDEEINPTLIALSESLQESRHSLDELANDVATEANTEEESRKPSSAIVAPDEPSPDLLILEKELPATFTACAGDFPLESCIEADDNKISNLSTISLTLDHPPPIIDEVTNDVVKKSLSLEMPEGVSLNLDAPSLVYLDDGAIEPHSLNNSDVGEGTEAIKSPPCLEDELPATSTACPGDFPLESCIEPDDKKISNLSTISLSLDHPPPIIDEVANDVVKQSLSLEMPEGVSLNLDAPSLVNLDDGAIEPHSLNKSDVGEGTEAIKSPPCLEVVEVEKSVDAPCSFEAEVSTLEHLCVDNGSDFGTLLMSPSSDQSPTIIESTLSKLSEDIPSEAQDIESSVFSEVIEHDLDAAGAEVIDNSCDEPGHDNGLEFNPVVASDEQTSPVTESAFSKPSDSVPSHAEVAGSSVCLDEDLDARGADVVDSSTADNTCVAVDHNGPSDFFGISTSQELCSASIESKPSALVDDIRSQGVAVESQVWSEILEKDFDVTCADHSNVMSSCIKTDMCNRSDLNTDSWSESSSEAQFHSIIASPSLGTSNDLFIEVEKVDSSMCLEVTEGNLDTTCLDAVATSTDENLCKQQVGDYGPSNVIFMVSTHDTSCTTTDYIENDHLIELTMTSSEVSKDLPHQVVNQSEQCSEILEQTVSASSSNRNLVQVKDLVAETLEDKLTNAAALPSFATETPESTAETVDYVDNEFASSALSKDLTFEGKADDLSFDVVEGDHDSNDLVDSSMMKEEVINDDQSKLTLFLSSSVVELPDTVESPVPMGGSTMENSCQEDANDDPSNFALSSYSPPEEFPTNSQECACTMESPSPEDFLSSVESDSASKLEIIDATLEVTSSDTIQIEDLCVDGGSNTPSSNLVSLLSSSHDKFSATTGDMNVDIATESTSPESCLGLPVENATVASPCQEEVVQTSSINAVETLRLEESCVETNVQDPSRLVQSSLSAEDIPAVLVTPKDDVAVEAMSTEFSPNLPSEDETANDTEPCLDTSKQELETSIIAPMVDVIPSGVDEDTSDAESLLIASFSDEEAPVIVNDMTIDPVLATRSLDWFVDLQSEEIVANESTKCLEIGEDQEIEMTCSDIFVKIDVNNPCNMTTISCLPETQSSDAVSTNVAMTLDKGAVTCMQRLEQELYAPGSDVADTSSLVSESSQSQSKETEKEDGEETNQKINHEDAKPELYAPGSDVADTSSLVSESSQSQSKETEKEDGEETNQKINEEDAKPEIEDPTEVDDSSDDEKLETTNNDMNMNMTSSCSEKLQSIENVPTLPATTDNDTHDSPTKCTKPIEGTGPHESSIWCCLNF